MMKIFFNKLVNALSYCFIIDKTQADIVSMIKKFDVEKLDESLIPIGAVINKQEYYRASQIFNRNCLLKTNKTFVLFKISEDLSKVSESLKLFYDVDLIDEIVLHGQCVAQYVLNQHQNIKNLDIHISLNFEEFIKNIKKDFYPLDKLINLGISQADIDQLKIPNGYQYEKIIQHEKTIFDKIVCNLFEHLEDESFDSADPGMVENSNSTDDHLDFNMFLNKNTHLKVVKITNGSNYKLNIKFQDKKFDIYTQEPLNIYQTYVNVGAYHTSQDYNYLIANLHGSLEFFADVFHKKISVNLCNKNDTFKLSEKCFLAQLDFPQYEENPYYFITPKNTLELKKLYYVVSEKSKENIPTKKINLFRQHFLNLKLMKNIKEAPVFSNCAIKKKKI